MYLKTQAFITKTTLLYKSLYLLGQLVRWQLSGFVKGITISTSVTHNLHNSKGPSFDIFGLLYIHFCSILCGVVWLQPQSTSAPKMLFLNNFLNYLMIIILKLDLLVRDEEGQLSPMFISYKMILYF